MATVGESLKANIRIGGNIDPSWRNSVSALKKGLSGATSEVNRLTREQDKLARKIREGVKAGKDISGLKADYEKLGKKIKDATGQQDKFNRQLERAERLERWKGRGKMALKGAGGLVIGGGLASWGMLAGGAAAVMNRNSLTAENAGKARSYGVDYGTYAAWDSLGKQMGLNGENLGDLAEELKNKVGEYKALGKMSSLEDAFSMMGFGEHDFAGLDNLQMMEKIFERALRMEDEQKAASALDMLMGGEANKILTWMRLSGRTYRDLIDEQKRYNLVTRGGAGGAVEGHVALSNLQTVLSSAIDEISGQLGKDLAPTIREVTDDLAGWFKDGGITRIKDFIHDDAIPALMFFGEGVWTIGRAAYGLASNLIKWGLVSDERDDRRDVLRSMARTGSVDLARKTAAGNGQSEWFEQQLKENPDLPGQIIRTWTRTRGFMGIGDDDDAFNKSLERYLGPKSEPDWMGMQKKMQDMLPPGKGAADPLSALKYEPGQSLRMEVKPVYQIRADFSITQRPGEDGTQLAQRVTDNLGDINFGQRASMTDAYAGWDN